MSKIFDALKKADHLRAEGVVDAVLEDAITTSSPMLAAPAAGPEAPVVAGHSTPLSDPVPGAADASPGVAPYQPRVAAMQVSALAPVFPFEDLHSQAAEQYRMIRTKVLHHPMQPRAIVVTSPTSGNGFRADSVGLRWGCFGGATGSYGSRCMYEVPGVGFQGKDDRNGLKLRRRVVSLEAAGLRLLLQLAGVGLFLANETL